jgi:hypothetical protein
MTIISLDYIISHCNAFKRAYLFDGMHPWSVIWKRFNLLYSKITLEHSNHCTTILKRSHTSHQQENPFGRVSVVIHPNGIILPPRTGGTWCKSSANSVHCSFVAKLGPYIKTALLHVLFPSFHFLFPSRVLNFPAPDSDVVSGRRNLSSGTFCLIRDLSFVWGRRIAKVWTWSTCIMDIGLKCGRDLNYANIASNKNRLV